MTNEALIKEAADAMKNAYAPYSNFKVGAALLTKNGEVFKGCNVENASYGLSNCAERTAVFKAISEGVKAFEKIAIVGGRDGMIENICPPCGSCRQVLSEFCGKDFEIILSDDGKKASVFKLSELLPLNFKLED